MDVVEYYKSKGIDVSDLTDGKKIRGLDAPHSLSGIEIVFDDDGYKFYEKSVIISAYKETKDDPCCIISFKADGRSFPTALLLQWETERPSRTRESGGVRTVWLDAKDLDLERVEKILEGHEVLEFLIEKSHRKES